MGLQKIYRATNEATGEVIEGTAKELAERIGVCADHIRQCTTRGKKIKSEWDVEVAYSSENSALKDGITLKNAREWDEFTEPIREYIRRRNAKRKQ